MRLLSLICGLLILTTWSVRADLPPDSVADVSNFFESPAEDAHAVFRNKIHNAKSSIILEMFHLTDMAIADELVAAKNRGLEVKVILDGTVMKSSSSVVVINKLNSGKVDWQKSSPAFSITHSKAMLIDGNEVIISTMNLTSFGSTKRDWGYITQDETILSDVKALFAADWENAKSGSMITPDQQSPDLVVSPTNSLNRLVTLIQSARSTIELTVENLTSHEILNALLQAQKNGVTVRVLTPQEPEGSSPDFNRNSSLTLIAGGAEARQMPSPATVEQPYLHGKALIVDHQAAYLGSENMSFNSLTKARELGVILRDQNVVDRLVSDFESDWTHAILPDSAKAPTPAGQ